MPAVLVLGGLMVWDTWRARGFAWLRRRRNWMFLAGFVALGAPWPGADLVLGVAPEHAVDLLLRDLSALHEQLPHGAVPLLLLQEEDLDELSALADRLSGSGRCLVHRDLQSRNVMVREGEPFLIDFQGMRFGSPFYDLASLLCDPYVEFEEGEREELLEFYHRMMAEGPDLADFRNSFWEASAQRLMQALGAYGFLGLRKGLKDFLEPIPAALHNLRLAASQTESLSRLLDLSLACGRAVEQRGSLPGIADNLSRPA